jgi:hypothetical protein
MNPSSIFPVSMPHDIKEYLEKKCTCLLCGNKCLTFKDELWQIGNEINVFCFCEQKNHAFEACITKLNSEIFISEETIDFSFEDYDFRIKFFRRFYPYLRTEIEKKHIHTGDTQKMVLTETTDHIKIKPFSPKRLAAVINSVMLLA